MNFVVLPYTFYKTICYLRVRCRPSGCWWVWVCQKTRFVSSTAVQCRVSQGECVLSRVHWSPLCQPPATWNCGTRTGNVCHPRVQSPSLRCTWRMDPIRVCAPGMSETCACRKGKLKTCNFTKRTFFNSISYYREKHKRKTLHHKHFVEICGRWMKKISRFSQFARIPVNYPKLSMKHLQLKSLFEEMTGLDQLKNAFIWDTTETFHHGSRRM